MIALTCKFNWPWFSAFSKANLPPTLLALRDDENVSLFNRALLEAAYPQELAKRVAFKEDPPSHEDTDLVDFDKWLQNPFGKMPSESILAAALIGSGLLGTLFSIIRRKAKPSPHEILSIGHLISGVSAGFVTFLAIRGGKSVFLMTFTTDVVQVNPYTASFAAFLVGLFTDKAYVSLTTIVDRFVKKAEPETSPPQPQSEEKASPSAQTKLKNDPIE